MESSDEDDDSDVFYSCDSDYTLSTSNSNSSPLKAATINKSIMDDPPQGIINVNIISILMFSTLLFHNVILHVAMPRCDTCFFLHYQ